MSQLKDIFYFHITNSVVKKCKKNIRNNSYLADDFATFDNLLPNGDEAMVVLKL
jgi:hypothetical protein